MHWFAFISISITKEGKLTTTAFCGIAIFLYFRGNYQVIFISTIYSMKPVYNYYLLFMFCLKS